MSNIVIVSALLERLRVLFPEANPKRKLIAHVNDGLDPVRAQLKQIIEDADANQNIADEKAKSFGMEITRLSYDFEDLIESYVLEDASRMNWFLCRIFKRSSQQIKVIEKLCKELAGMIIQACESKPSDTSQVQAPPVRRPGQFLTPASVADAREAYHVVGMFEDQHEVATALTNGSLQLTFVLICGMGGSGKTTVARLLFHSYEIKCHFSVRAWIRVSKNYQTRGILLEIIARISETWVNRRDAMDMPEEDLAERIYRSLKGRCYLIVLDDVRSADAWLSLRMAFPNDNNGSRILITTRTKEVALQMGVPDTNIHMIGLLSEKESAVLFRRTARLDGEEVNPEKLQIANEIARRICGIPLAIIVLASALSGRPLDEWKLILEQLGGTSSDQISVSDSLPVVFNLIYKNLPLRLRPCLLYLGNFPEDAEIEMDTLCQLWIAEGLISMDDVRHVETMMDVAARYLDELVQANFVKMAEEEVLGQRRFRTCSIHDRIRDFCQTKGKEDKFFEVMDLGDENQAMSSAFRCTIYLDKFERINAQLYAKADYLRSLLFFSSSLSEQGHIRPREITNLNNFIWLRVLHLFGVYFKDGKFPKGVEKLVYLRYLGFRECYLEELPSSVSNMLYLQTLDLRIRNECEMTIPDVFDNLESLKYLYLPLAYRSHNQEKLHLGKLIELEILENFDTSLCNAEDLLKMTNLVELVVTTERDVSGIHRILYAVKNKLSNLRSISFNIRSFDCHSERRFSAMEKVFNSRALHALEVEGHLGKLPQFDKISWELTEIVLNGSELVEDPMQILQELLNLRILILEIEAYIEKKMKCSSFGFRQLRYLKFSKLYNLEDWEVEEGAMPFLRTLVIENCKKLKMLPDGLQFTLNLDKLEIASMPNEFVGRIQKSEGTEGEDFYKIRHVKSNVKIDGQLLILKERQQAGPREDPQSSSTL